MVEPLGMAPHQIVQSPILTSNQARHILPILFLSGNRHGWWALDFGLKINC
jgi:hypothetical protein